MSVERCGLDLAIPNVAVEDVVLPRRLAGDQIRLRPCDADADVARAIRIAREREAIVVGRGGAGGLGIETCMSACAVNRGSGVSDKVKGAVEVDVAHHCGFGTPIICAVLEDTCKYISFYHFLIDAEHLHRESIHR